MRACMSGLLTAALVVAAASPAAAQGLDFVEQWSHTLDDTGAPIALSSPNLATLGGVPAVVVGDRAGHVYAFSLATGDAISGWPASTRGIPVDSTPSVAALTPGSPDDTVFVGVGNAATPHEGGYEAFNPNGTEKWYVAVRDPATDQAAGATSAVRASLTVGDLQGSTDVVAPSVGQEEYAINAATGATLPGFPWFTADSGFSTPAIADLYDNGKNEIIEGGDQTAGMAQWVQYSQGGHLRILSPTGNAGTGSSSGGLVCEYNANQVVESSPAVGPFLAKGNLGIVIGTGIYWKGAPDTDKLLAFGTHCNLVWMASLDGDTGSSPALADIEGNGSLEVVEGTDNTRGGGSVYALDGASGSVIWRQNVDGEVIGSVVTADLGGGYQDVIVPTTEGAEILDGRTGRLLTTLERGVGLQSSPLVTEDPDGAIGITIAGYNGHNQGVIEHYELVGSNGAGVDAYGAWPMFHHDPQLTGNAAAVSVSAPVQAPAIVSRCRKPPARPSGYYEVGSGGAVYSYGNVAYCGSMAGQHLAGPVVGIAATPGGGGYWLADSTGQVYAFGDAQFYGPPDPLPIKAPIVDIAATPDGRGYWLVARDGQVYAFGDAKFYGPKILLQLSAPIVAIAAGPGGRGYWLVGANGAMFTFGDAVAHSSAAQVSGPVVGIAPDSATGGYWLVNAYGKVYGFDAPTYAPPGSSVAGYGIADAITAIAPLPDGAGYRLVDTGGQLFCYGLATDEGSASTQGPGRPIVGIAAP